MIDWPSVFDRKGFTPFMLPLASLAFFYGLGVRLRLMAYKRIMRKRSLPGKVISIGNITIGGTGKTPAACMLAEWAFKEGYRVAVLSRGYSGQYRAKVLEVSDGTIINARPAEVGDEPYLLAKRLRGIPVIVSKDRYQAGLLAHSKFKTNFFILDDGFQHLGLKRDLDLVLLDTVSPFGNGHLLPWGPLREPFEQLGRAHAIIMTRAPYGSFTNDLQDTLTRHFPGKRLFKADHMVEELVFPNKNTRFTPDYLKGKRVLAFAGIARPQLFKDTLTRVGADPIFFRGFRDHHVLTHHEFKNMIAEKERIGAQFIVTTEKDWVRLEGLANDYPDLAYLTIRFGFLFGQDEFFQMIKEKGTNTF